MNNRLLKELAQKERLASLGQASAEFVHDLGNPLTIVWGYVQLLAQETGEIRKGRRPSNATSAKELNIIEQNVRLCRELLTMWQSYGSVEASPHKPISVSQIVREVVKGVGSDGRAKRLELKCDICEDACTLVGDSVQIIRAIQNVIINASGLHRKQGGVAVNCHRKDFYVDIRVEDTGEGICRRRWRRFSIPISRPNKARAAPASASISPKRWSKITTARSKWTARPGGHDFHHSLAAFE